MQPTPADTRLTRSLARLDACAPCVRPPPVMVTPSHQGRHLQKLTVLNSALHFLTFHCLDFVFTDVSCAREHPHAPVALDPMLTRAACVRLCLRCLRSRTPLRAPRSSRTLLRTST